MTAPTYTAGLTTPFVVRIVKTDVSQSTQFTLQVLDVAGNSTTCDPELVQVGRTKDLPRRVRMSVNSNETQATIYNGTPGVTELDIKVNNKTVEIDDLKPGEVRTVDLSDLMGGRRDQDRVVITAKGKQGGSAVVLFSDEGLTVP